MVGRLNGAPYALDLDSLASVFLDDLEQRLALEIGIERQRPIWHTIPTFKIGWHPGISIAQAPGQDRLRTDDVADRFEKLPSQAGDQCVTLADLAGKRVIDHVEFGDQHIELERR